MKDSGTAHSVIEPDNKVQDNKMSISEWVVILGVLGFVAAFLGRGIVF